MEVFGGQKILKIPEIDKSKTWGYFDWACQGSAVTCGAGGIIFIKGNHVVAFKAAVGVGTNNRAEMFALWSMQ
jgi:ribonuclease HI